MAKTKLLLLDADIVITAHELGIWEELKTAYRIAVPATIVREARYFKSENGGRSISLQAEIDLGYWQFSFAAAHIERGDALANSEGSAERFGRRRPRDPMRAGLVSG